MIRLYIDHSAPESAELIEALESLIVAHEVLEGEQGDGAPHGAALPTLVEGRTVVSGADEIRAYLDQLAAELKLDRSVSGDACYLNPDRPWTCL